MAVRVPTTDQIVEVGAHLGMRLGESEAAQYLAAMKPLLDGYDTVANTAVFDATGHPALTIPCGLSDGLPVGLMLVGRHFDEATIYRAANAYEQSVDWKTL